MEKQSFEYWENYFGMWFKEEDKTSDELTKKDFVKLIAHYHPVKLSQNGQQAKEAGRLLGFHMF